LTDERQLIEAAQAGNRIAFKQLVESNMKQLYYLAYDLTGNHEDAEDLSQEVFVRAYKNLARFRGDARFSTWLYRITVNSASSMHRTRYFKFRRQQDSLEHAQNISNKESGPFEKAGQSLVNDHVYRAMECLSLKERAAFTLRHLHDQSIAQIAETMNLSNGTVKSLLFRGLQKMRRELEGIKNEFE